MTWHRLYHSRTYFWGKTDDSLGMRVIYNEEGVSLREMSFSRRKQAREMYESESRSLVSDSLLPHGLYSRWNSPGQNTGVGSLSLLQLIFPTQGLNLGLPHCRQILCTSWDTRETPRILEWVGDVKLGREWNRWSPWGWTETSSLSLSPGLQLCWRDVFQNMVSFSTRLTKCLAQQGSCRSHRSCRQTCVPHHPEGQQVRDGNCVYKLYPCWVFRTHLSSIKCLQLLLQAYQLLHKWSLWLQ